MTFMERKIFILGAFIISLSLFFSNTNAQQTDSVSSSHAIFSDNFSKDVIGKFPLNWVSNRPGEVVAPRSLPGRWFKMHAQGTYLPKLAQDLPKNFTIDFDFIHQANSNGNNTTEITLFSKPKNAVNDSLFPGTCGVKIVLETFIVSCLCYNNLTPSDQKSTEFRSKIFQANNIVKISIKVEEQVLHVFVNGFECLKVPQCQNSNETLNAVRFYLWGSLAEPMISNFKIY